MRLPLTLLGLLGLAAGMWMCDAARAGEGLRGAVPSVDELAQAVENAQERLGRWQAFYSLREQALSYQEWQAADEHIMPGFSQHGNYLHDSQAGVYCLRWRPATEIASQQPDVEEIYVAASGMTTVRFDNKRRMAQVKPSAAWPAAAEKMPATRVGYPFLAGLPLSRALREAREIHITRGKVDENLIYFQVDLLLNSSLSTSAGLAPAPRYFQVRLFPARSYLPFHLQEFDLSQQASLKLEHLEKASLPILLQQGQYDLRRLDENQDVWMPHHVTFFQQADASPGMASEVLIRHYEVGQQVLPRLNPDLPPGITVQDARAGRTYRVDLKPVE